MMIKITQVTVMKEDGKTFDLGNYVLTIEDEGGGEFLSVTEHHDSDHLGISIDTVGWSELRNAIDGMIDDCKEA